LVFQQQDGGKTALAQFEATGIESRMAPSPSSSRLFRF
jgi:hypothetical protein